MTQDKLKETVTLNDLPKFSPWPHRLLGLTPFEQKKKTHRELVREYEQEKWGKLLEMVQNAPQQVTLPWVLECVFSQRSEDEFIIVKEECKLVPAQEGRALTLQVILSHLRHYLPSHHIVELGAGFGNILIDIAQQKDFSGAEFYAGEFTQSGQKIIQILTKNQGIKCTTGNCDFNRDPIIDLSIPENAIIYTAMSAVCVPQLQDHFIDNLIQLKPKVVVHFEPCYEALDSNTLLGALCQKYIEFNDYNRNLLSLIKRYVDKGEVELIDVKPNVIGTNPLLPLTIISWRPRNAAI